MVATYLADKVIEIKAEMKRLGIWRKQIPAWVHEYAERSIATEEDFTGWLQFIYLPNVQQKEWQSNSKRLIVPQAMKFFGEDVKKGKLLQLLIELDALI